MKDFDKIKEKKKDDEFKGFLFIGLIFVLAVGLIVYIIIQLTNQYIELKEKLTEAENEQVVEERVTNPYEAESKIVLSMDNKSKIKEIEQKVEETTNIKQIFDLKEAKTQEQDKKEIPKQPEKKKDIKTDTVLKKPDKKEKKVVKQNIVKKKEIKKSSSASTQKSKYKYVLQLMAFKDKNVAIKQKEKLKKYFPDIFIMKIDLGKKGVWYRLRCCYFDSYQEAKVKANELNKKYGLKPIVVKTDK